MNYKKIYKEIVDRGRSRVLSGYKEKHHIVPVCMGGTNKKSNLVDLTAKEHYICHLLLMEMFPENKSLKYAFWMMSHTRVGMKTSGRVYEELKTFISSNMRDNVGTDEAISKMSKARRESLKIYNPWEGKKHSKESRLKMSKSAKARNISKESEIKRREKISKTLKGKLKSKQHSANISKSKKGKNNPMFGKKWELVDGKRIYYENNNDRN